MVPVLLTRFATVLGVLVVAGAGAGAASAATLSQIASELRSDGVYVDPAAELAGEVDEAAVEAAVARARTDTYVAVLPSSAGPADQMPAALRRAVQADGSYVALTGPSLRAGSTQTREGVAGSLARQAVEENGDRKSVV